MGESASAARTVLSSARRAGVMPSSPSTSGTLAVSVASVHTGTGALLSVTTLVPPRSDTHHRWWPRNQQQPRAAESLPRLSPLFVIGLFGHLMECGSPGDGRRVGVEAPGGSVALTAGQTPRTSMRECRLDSASASASLSGQCRHRRSRRDARPVRFPWWAAADVTGSLTTCREPVRVVWGSRSGGASISVGWGGRLTREGSCVRHGQTDRLLAQAAATQPDRGAVRRDAGRPPPRPPAFADRTCSPARRAAAAR